MRHILALTIPAGGFPSLVPWMTAQIGRREAMARASEYSASTLIFSHATTSASHLASASQVAAANASSPIGAVTKMEENADVASSFTSEHANKQTMADKAHDSSLRPATSDPEKTRWWSQMRRYQADASDNNDISSLSSDHTNDDDDSSLSSSDDDKDDDSTASYGLR
jgi:hypothetical protein